MDIPLISEYKVGFITRRICQSLFGGLRILLGFPAPPYIYIFQLILYLLPWIISSGLTFLVESKLMLALQASIVQGILMFLLVLITQTLATRKNKSTINSEKSNHLDEDDIVLFSGCCSSDTFSYLFPMKRNFMILLFHSLVTGVMNGLTLYYLAPTHQMALWKNYNVTVILYVFGWLSLCNAHYALSVNSPPEPATYKPINSQLWGPLHRPLYILMILVLHFSIRGNTCCAVLDANLHLLFAFLPALWMLGILPPVEALFHWAAEQAILHLAGGSPITNYIWLSFNILLFLGEAILLYHVKNWTSAVIISSCFGWLLSTDLESFLRWLSKKCSTTATSSLISRTFTLKDVLYYVASAFIALAVSAIGIQMHQEMENLSSRYILGCCIILVCIIIWILGQLHSVYFVNIIRNPIFPVVDDRLVSLRNGKRQMRPIWIIRYIVLNCASPVMMLLYFSSSGSAPVTGAGTSEQYWVVLTYIGLIYAFRKIWQRTEACLLEISVLEILYNFQIFKYDPRDFTRLFLLVAFCCSVFMRIISGLQMITVLVVTFISHPKQRLRYGWLLIVIDVIILPFIGGMCLLSSLLSAPLTPLLTLPFFVITYPRPTKFWPDQVEEFSNGKEDSLFYKQVIPSFLNQFSKAISSGSLGWVDAGNYYLARYQDRLLWIQILEKGFGFVKLCVKGLELQETSCHTLEASEVDSIFGYAFPSSDQNDNSSRINLHMAHTLSACDALIANSYSDAKGVLTGIIDSPDLSKIVENLFPKVLLWCLIHNQIQTRIDAHNEAEEAKKKSKEGASKKEQNAKKSNNLNKVVFEKEIPPAEPTITSNHNFVSNERYLDMERTVTGTGVGSVDKWAIKTTSSSLDSLWSDDFDFLGDSEMLDVRANDAATVSKGSIQENQRPTSWTSLPGLVEDEDDSSGNEDPILESQVLVTSQGFHSVELGGVPELPLLNLVCDNCDSELKPPNAWRILYEKLRVESMKGKSFSDEWFQTATKTLIEKLNFDNFVGQELDYSLMQEYSSIVKMCCSSIGFESRKEEAFDSAYIFRIFTGDLPVSRFLAELNDCCQLKDLLIKSFRYSFKLAIDALLLSETLEYNELAEQLFEFDKKWYIGIPKDKNWLDSISKSKAFVFTVDFNRNEDTYTSRLLSIRDLPVFVGSLNPATISGIWSSLALELLYLTNDDEERYSIQAHPTLLRNLTVQAANFPLGYPVYNSGLVCIKGY